MMNTLTRRLVPTLAGLALVLPISGSAASAPPLPTQAAIVQTGAGPCGAAHASGGGIWIAVYETGTLLRLGPDGDVLRRVAVGKSACRLAANERHIWVTRDGANEIVGVDVGSGQTRTVAVGAVPLDVIRALGFLWVTNWDDGTVMRIDEERGVVVDTIDVGPYPIGLAACGGRIWVGHGRAARAVTTLDPKTLRVRKIAVGAMPQWPNCIKGAVWITTPDSVLRLHPGTGRVLSRLKIDDTIADAAAAPDGLVWVTDKQHSVVYRVTANGRAVVDSFPAGPGAYGLLRTGRSMWVTSFAGSDVRRFEVG